MCHSIADSQGMDFMPWLVIMRQISTTALGLGKGVYRWRFESDETGMRVCAMQFTSSAWTSSGIAMEKAGTAACCIALSLATAGDAKRDL